MTSDEEYQLELVQAERDDALRQVETLRAENKALETATRDELKRVTEQLADANTASDLNCHGWKECRAELARVTAELVEANHWRKRWCDDYHAAAQQAQATFDERKHLKTELARVTAERDEHKAQSIATPVSCCSARADLATLREQLATATIERDAFVTAAINGAACLTDASKRLATLETAARETLRQLKADPSADVDETLLERALERENGR